MKRNLLISLSLFGTLCFGMQTVSAEDSAKYAFISKSLNNPYNVAMSEGFEEIITANGGECIINHPLNATAESQIPIIESVISQEADVIVLAANDTTSLSPVLTSAAEDGIKVISVDSDTAVNDRLLFCNQADANLIGSLLVQAIYDIADGEGQFAILSTTPTATNQVAWIDVMTSILESEEKYKNLELAEIVFGEDDTEKSSALTQELLQNYPDLKVICSPTTVGIAAAAQVIKDENSSVKLTGLGLPSQMVSFVGDDLPCPYMYFWNPVDLGRLAAYTAINLHNGSLEVKENNSFVAPAFDNKTFGITHSGNNPDALEVLLGDLICFTPENIAEWSDVF